MCTVCGVCRYMVCLCGVYVYTSKKKVVFVPRQEFRTIDQNLSEVGA